MTHDETVAKTPLTTLRRAFEAEHLRRNAERRAREEMERAQQEADLARVEQLRALLADDPAFLAEKGLKVSVSPTRFAVVLDHARFRIQAYFESGRIDVHAADKSMVNPPTASPRKSQNVERVEDALLLIAQYLADESF